MASGGLCVMMDLVGPMLMSPAGSWGSILHYFMIWLETWSESYLASHSFSACALYTLKK